MPITRITVPVVILDNGKGLPLPEYASTGSAGMDLRAAINGDIVITARETIAVATGISIALPDGIEGQVRPRSGLALNHGIGVINSPGTIDSDYRGEIKILLTNFSNKSYTVRRGDRIGQLVISRFEKATWHPVDNLPESERGEGGFGHSGK